MKSILIGLAFLIGGQLAVAATDTDEIKYCLQHWGDHPFNKKAPTFRIMSSKVKVMGIGNETQDKEVTKTPDLVLIKPAVNVMSKSVINLMNPNGWYCLKGKVDVLGKTEINIHCKAHLATSTDNTTVMGSNTEDTGVTVLGKSVIHRLGCADKAEAKAESKEEKPEAEAN